jgi:hypothetical protein
MAQLGEVEKSARYYQQGLTLTTSNLTVLPE